MAPKRPSEAGGDDSKSKKPRSGFRVGPDNLPDGAWKRKVTKIKKDIIHKAKVKKAYAKIKEKEKEKDGQDDKGVTKEADEAGEVMHPTRELMLKDEEAAQNGVAPSAKQNGPSDGNRRRTRRPGYYDKQLAKASQRKAESEEWAAERARRQKERNEKIEERQRYKKAMAKTIGRDGKKKLGRESTLLLDKVKKMVAEGG